MMARPKCFGQLPMNWGSPAYACGLCAARVECTKSIKSTRSPKTPSVAGRHCYGEYLNLEEAVEDRGCSSCPDGLSGLCEIATRDTLKKVGTPRRWVSGIPTTEDLSSYPGEALAKEALKSGVDAILDERGKRYGKFTNHADISQDFKHRMRGCSSWPKLAPDQREALEMIAHKVARILNGDPNYADSWVDIAGYAQLVADRLEGKVR